LSLRKLYEQTLANQARTLHDRDTAVAGVVKEMVAAFARDGDYTATIKDFTERGFELDVRANLARVGRPVTLSYADVWQAYDNNGGSTARAASDMMERVITILAQQQALANRRTEFKTKLLDLR
jgi:hypothetical protein